MLEFDDIQHLLLTRAPALTARYEFLSFRDGAGGRAWVSAIKETIHSAASMRAGVDRDKRWVTAAFTWNGLRALGLDEAALESFPVEFKQGMAARAEMLGDAGLNAPEHWIGGLASPDLHAIVILFARDDAEHDRCVSEHAKLIAGCPGVEVLSVLDLHAIPPFGYAHEHFGYRDRLSELAIEGSGVDPTPGTGEPLKPGEFILGYPDEYGVTADSPKPEVLARNGSYMAYRRLEEHVGKFRDFLRQHGDTVEEQELIAAKLMGRWRSGAPLVLAPEKDDPALGADMQRNNDFAYKETDPHGYAVPLGAHIRRMNPRDTAHNMNRRRMIRRGRRMGLLCRKAFRTTGSNAGSPPSSSAPASSDSSSSHRTSGSTTGTSTISATNATRSSARKTERWSSRSPSDPFARKSSACRPSPQSRAARTFFSRVSRGLAIWPR